MEQSVSNFENTWDVSCGANKKNHFQWVFLWGGGVCSRGNRILINIDEFRRIYEWSHCFCKVKWMEPAAVLSNRITEEPSAFGNNPYATIAKTMKN